MTDDTRDPPPGAPRKRPTPTIDLTATEISAAPQSGGKTEAGAEQNPHVAASRDKADTEAGASGTKPGQGPSMFERWQFNMSWLAAIAAVGGAVAIFLVGLLAGVMSGGHESAGDKIARLEAQLRDLSGRPATTADPALGGRVAALEAAMKAATDSAAGRERRSDEIAVVAREAKSRADAAANAAEGAQKSRAGASDVARADIDALVARIAALEQVARANESELAKRVASTDDPKSRLAIAASALREAAERGNPFVSELAAAKSLAADPKLLAPLEAFAAGGVPTDTVLARDLSALLPTIVKAGGRETRDGNFLERLQANAGKLVRIRPVGEIPGDEPDQIIARIEVRAANLDIGGARGELAKLPAAMRVPTEPWIKKAETRDTALAAARQFALGALAAIGKPGS